MTPGTALYARYGHAALALHIPGRPAVVFNFGYADFNDPNLVLDTLRGRARFFLAVESLRDTLRKYRRERRGIIAYRLQLDSGATARLIRALFKHSRPENRTYIYHHLHDNCATRPRDLIDAATDGAVKRELSARPTANTVRELVRRGLPDRPGVLLFSELVMGRRVDRSLSAWDEGFLPAALVSHLDALTIRQTKLLGRPRVLLRAPSALPRSGTPLGGLWLLLVATPALTAAAAFGAHYRRSDRPVLGLSLLGGPALVLGLVATLVWSTTWISGMPEIRENELLLYWWPTDLLLPFLAPRRQTGGNRLRQYAILRLGVLLLVGLGHLVGLLYQQPRALALVVLLPFVAIAVLPKAYRARR